MILKLRCEAGAALFSADSGSNLAEIPVGSEKKSLNKCVLQGLFFIKVVTHKKDNGVEDGHAILFSRHPDYRQNGTGTGSTMSWRWNQRIKSGSQ